MVSMSAIYRMFGVRSQRSSSDNSIIYVAREDTAFRISIGGEELDIGTIYFYTVGRHATDPMPILVPFPTPEFNPHTTITLDVPPQMVNNRTFVPLRAISEVFGATVGWDNDTRTVTITTLEEIPQ